jgi:hypothetical protein
MSAIDFSTAIEGDAGNDAGNVLDDLRMAGKILASPTLAPEAYPCWNRFAMNVLSCDPKIKARCSMARIVIERPPLKEFRMNRLFSLLLLGCAASVLMTFSGVSQAQTFTVLHAFNGDGQSPYDTLFLAKGKLYLVPLDVSSGTDSHEQEGSRQATRDSRLMELSFNSSARIFPTLNRTYPVVPAPPDFGHSQIANWPIRSK